MTGALGPAGRSLCEQLRDRGVPVVGLDVAAHEDGGLRLRRIPSAADRNFGAELMRVAYEANADLLIPTLSAELPILAELAESHAPPTPRIEIGPTDGVCTANDKWLTYLRLADAGVAVPRSFLPSWLDERAGQWLGDPVVRPRVSRGGRDVRLHSAAAASRFDDTMIVQEFVPGTEYDANLYLSGACDVVVVLERMQPTCQRLGNAELVRRLGLGQALDVAALALRAARALRLVGPVDVDIRRRADGLPVVLQINARFGPNSAYAPEVLDAAISALPVAMHPVTTPV